LIALLPSSFNLAKGCVVAYTFRKQHFNNKRSGLSRWLRAAQ